MSENIFQNIKKITRNFKRVNIVTNHTEKFKKIEKHLYEQEGIMITVGNNKRKSLAKSKVIINVDFPTELINQYYIYEDAIIINLRKNLKIKSKRFNGKIISDYDINYINGDLPKNDKFENRDIYEALFYKKQPFEDIMKKIEKDKVSIKI